MSVTICPHCGYNRAPGVVGKGAVKGGAVGVCFLLNPILGAVALSGLALDAWRKAGKEEIQCPGCNKYYHS